MEAQEQKLTFGFRVKRELKDDWRLFWEEAGHSFQNLEEALERKSLRVRFMELCTNIEQALDWTFHKLVRIWKIIMN